MQKLNYLGRKFYHPTYGEVKVIEQHPDYAGRTVFTIQFKNTGSTTVVDPNNLRHLRFKDPFAPNIAGVGYFGNTAHNYGYNKKEYGRVYAIWSQMLNRCYNQNNKDYPYYGGLGVTVCDRWHNFSNFFYDFIHMPNFEKWLNSPNNSYHLDKDIKQMGLPMNYRIYSPETCVLVPAHENINQMVISNFGFKNVNCDYVGISYVDNSWQAYLNKDGKQLMMARFTDPLSAAVYKECYAHYKYRMAMVNDANKVPITMEAFSQAKSNRISNGEPYPYKKMFEIVDNTEPFDPNKFGYKKLLESP